MSGNLGAVAHLREETGILHFLPEETPLAAARATLGADAFEPAWREDRATKLEEAVRYALEGRRARGT
jgi:hypothetical protein